MLVHNDDTRLHKPPPGWVHADPSNPLQCVTLDAEVFLVRRIA